MGIECFLVVRLPRAVEALRRYAEPARGACGSRPYHDAEVVIGEVPWREERWWGSADPGHSIRGDPRWPPRCRCDYAFSADDHWQRNFHQLFERADGAGGRFVLRDAPAGAMWEATWWPAAEDRGPDGRCLVVRLPDGVDWMIDGPANSGGRWTRTGEAPRLTVRPSIATRGYHGFLTDGVLQAC